MTETYFTSTVEGEEALRQATSVKERTVKIRFGMENTGMFFLTPTLVGEAITQVLPASAILALGCLRGNHEFHCTLSDFAAREVLLGAGSVVVRSGGYTRTGYMEPLVPTRVSLRVLWCPAWVPQTAIYELLCSLAPVTEFVEVRARVGERAVHNLQFTAVLKDITPARIPDRVTLEVLGERIPLLLLVKGKPRSCFLCGSCNHTQASCPNPVCRYCKKSGHVVGNCPRKNHPWNNPGAAEAGAQQHSRPAPPCALPVALVAKPPAETTPAPQADAPQKDAGAPQMPAASVNSSEPVRETSKRKHVGASVEEPPASSSKKEVPTASDDKVEQVEQEEQVEETEEFSDSMEEMSLTPVSDSPASSPIVEASQDIVY